MKFYGSIWLYFIYIYSYIYVYVYIYMYMRMCNTNNNLYPVSLGSLDVKEDENYESEHVEYTSECRYNRN